MKTIVGTVVAILAYAASAGAQTTCPPGFPSGTTCYAGQEETGAYYLIAQPPDYNGQLILWNHGYTLSSPAPLGAGDLGPPFLLLFQGFAAAASSYRPDALGLGGWAVADAAADTESVRQRFVKIFGPPSETYVVGASEGGLVTAKVAEVYGTGSDGTLNYNGSMPMCGPLAGGRRNWYGGFDLRVVYQYYCQNLPLPEEPQYPLYLGLAPPPNPQLTQDELVARINDCTGILVSPEERTETQAQNLANILGVTKIPEGFLITDMLFATFALQELVLVRIGGLSPVTNLGVTYTGSSDDVALNKGVYRAGSDPTAVDYINSAYDPTGNVPMPTITIQTKGDGLVIVENEAAYLETLQAAGTDGNLVQTYTNANGHCEFTPSEFGGVFFSLVNWVQTGTPATPEQVVASCQDLGGPCAFDTEFSPQPFETRILPRDP